MMDCSVSRPNGADIEPKIALGAKASADFKVWTILLRKGARWSDGAAVHRG